MKTDFQVGKFYLELGYKVFDKFHDISRMVFGNLILVKVIIAGEIEFS